MEEDFEFRDKELTDARHEGIEHVNEAEAQASKELDALQVKRTQECENLKVKSHIQLEAAAHVVI